MSLEAIVKIYSLHCVDRHLRFWQKVEMTLGNRIILERQIKWREKLNQQDKQDWECENGCKMSEKTDSAHRAKTSTHLTEK